MNAAWEWSIFQCENRFKGDWLGKILEEAKACAEGVAAVKSKWRPAGRAPSHNSSLQRYLESSLVGTAGLVSACPGSISGSSLMDSSSSSASFSRLDGFFGSSDMAAFSIAVALLVGLMICWWTGGT